MMLAQRAAMPRVYSASDVALRVGYANHWALTTASTRRFRPPPSRVQPRRAGVPVLPPQGGARAVPSVKPRRER